MRRGAANPKRGDNRWTFRLYVSGWGPRYQMAFENLRHLCEEHFGGEYEIELVDLQKHPEQASADNIIAIPTVIKTSPEPVMRIVGDLSDAGKVLAALGYRPRLEQRTGMRETLGEASVKYLGHPSRRSTTP